MKLFVTIEIDVEEPPVVESAPPATIDGMVDQIRAHTSMIVSNFNGELVRFSVEKA